VGNLPEPVKAALLSALRRYTAYLASFSDDEEWLKKKVENELGASLLLVKQRCAGLESEWNQASHKSRVHASIAIPQFATTLLASETGRQLSQDCVTTREGLVFSVLQAVSLHSKLLSTALLVFFLCVCRCPFWAHRGSPDPISRSVV